MYFPNFIFINIFNFPNLEYREHCWVQNPFRVTEKSTGFSSADYEKLIEITSDVQLKDKFEEVSLDVFRRNLLEEYSDISEQAEQIPLKVAKT